MIFPFFIFFLIYSIKNQRKTESLSNYRNSVMSLDGAIREYSEKQKELYFNLEEYQGKLNAIKVCDILFLKLSFSYFLNSTKKKIEKNSTERQCLFRL